MNRNFLFSRKRRVVFTLLVLAMAAQLTFGQTSTTGAIRGTVTDSTGAVISGATVTVTSKAIGQVRTAKSDSSGQYAGRGPQPRLRRRFPNRRRSADDVRFRTSDRRGAASRNPR